MHTQSTHTSVQTISKSLWSHRDVALYCDFVDFVLSTLNLSVESFL